MAKHILKIESKYFKEVVNGNKTFEIRKNDRDFKQGDEVLLSEYKNGICTEQVEIATIGYVCDYEQKDGYVVFSLIN